MIHDNNSLNNSVNLSDRKYDINVAFDHIFVSKEKNSLLISETIVFRNEGQEIHYSKEDHTFFAISTPLDIRDLKTLAMECCLVEEEGMVYMDPMQSIKPGENFEMKISYTLLPQGPEYVFNKSTIYNTTTLSMFIDRKSGINLQGSLETLTLAGIEYNVQTLNDLGAGEIVSFPIKITQGPDYLYAGIVLVVLFSMGLIYLFKGKLKIRRKKALTLDELELEKRNIFHTIYGLKKHTLGEGSEEYRKLIEEYRNKLIQIFYDIDKMRPRN